MVKVPGIVRDIAAVVALIALLSAAGWICSELGVMGDHPPVTTRFAFQVLVIDANGTIMPNQTVYAIACLQKPAGLLAPTRYVDHVTLTGTTDKDGFAEIETDNYTLTRGDIIWMGASTNRSLLTADFDALTFDPGRIGRWGRYNYTDLGIHGPPVRAWARSILVRNSDGRMIDINGFSREAGFFPAVSSIDYFTYMDNRSWAYPIPWKPMGGPGPML